VRCRVRRTVSVLVLIERMIHLEDILSRNHAGLLFLIKLAGNERLNANQIQNVFFLLKEAGLPEANIDFVFAFPYSYSDQLLWKLEELISWKLVNREITEEKRFYTLSEEGEKALEKFQLSKKFCMVVERILSEPRDAVKAAALMRHLIKIKLSVSDALFCLRKEGFSPLALDKAERILMDLELLKVNGKGGLCENESSDFFHDSKFSNDVFRYEGSRGRHGL